MQVSKTEVAVALLSAALSAAVVLWANMTPQERVAVLQRLSNDPD